MRRSCCIQVDSKAFCDEKAPDLVRCGRDVSRRYSGHAEIRSTGGHQQEGEIEARCGLHKRLYTFMLQYEQPYLLEGEFAQLMLKGGNSSRAEYLLDPWNSAYWIRLKCRGDREATFVYSFGPNRRRDSSEWALKGDDIGADLLSVP